MNKKLGMDSKSGPSEFTLTFYFYVKSSFSSSQWVSFFFEVRF